MSKMTYLATLYAKNSNRPVGRVYGHDGAGSKEKVLAKASPCLFFYMQYKTFMLPASGSEQTEENLNVFLRTHRIVSVRSEFVAGETPSWCVLVEYVQAEGSGGVKSSMSSSQNKIDYMQVLPPDEFAIFADLRELRKSLAKRDGVPPFVVFTDEVLANIVKAKPDNLGKLAAIGGVGQVKIEKYGNDVLAVLRKFIKSSSQNEKTEKPDSTNC